ncbi:hypothetical protein C5C63_14660 [Rathayibacter sp. AY1B8]|nr:hypothetical protein C5C63_14660 [Rathayibacter sp. AY1B8]
MDTISSALDAIGHRMTSAHPDDELRAWAAGERGREAATELLIRSGLTKPDDPWIRQDRQWGAYAVDYDAVPYGRDGLCESQRAVLLLAASLADDVPVDLRGISRDLDYDHALLAITALTHAAGYHQLTHTIDSSGSAPRVIQRPPLITWDHELV